ncbi:hypothetical protein GMLC_16680 [Geomonas limicola]|uniref:Uncharacterized protein n=1 Tax=Geomonas limicola TaxID=2740186 RepID=A0A6V8NA03_9BACT|nr:hypothetical protein GMLC_16680 [Geomonas limicola]
MGAFQDQELEEEPVVVHRPPPFEIVVILVEGVAAGPRAALSRNFSHVPLLHEKVVLSKRSRR